MLLLEFLKQNILRDDRGDDDDESVGNCRLIDPLCGRSAGFGEKERREGRDGSEWNEGGGRETLCTTGWWGIREAASDFLESLQTDVKI